MQGMAGNIIHAIATTNAIVGGLIVVEALKVLAGQPDKCKARCLLPCLVYAHARAPKHRLPGASAQYAVSTRRKRVGVCARDSIFAEHLSPSDFAGVSAVLCQG